MSQTSSIRTSTTEAINPLSSDGRRAQAQGQDQLTMMFGVRDYIKSGAYKGHFTTSERSEIYCILVDISKAKNLKAFKTHAEKLTEFFYDEVEVKYSEKVQHKGETRVQACLVLKAPTTGESTSFSLTHLKDISDKQKSRTEDLLLSVMEKTGKYHAKQLSNFHSDGNTKCIALTMPSNSMALIGKKQRLQAKLFSDGLISSQEKFYCVITNEVLKKYSEEKIINGLQILKRLQTENYQLPEEYFHIYMKLHVFLDFTADSLDKPKTHIVAGMRLTNDAIPLEKQAEYVFNNLITQVNLTPPVMKRSAKELKVQAIGTGIYNWKQTCFMGACLQLLSVTFSDPELKLKFKGKLTYPAALGMLYLCYPPCNLDDMPDDIKPCDSDSDEVKAKKRQARDDYNQKKGDQRDGEIQKIATTLSQVGEQQLLNITDECEGIAELDLKGIKIDEILNKFFDFNAAFFNLMQKLASPLADEAQQPIEEFEALLSSYLDFAIATKRSTTLSLLNQPIKALEKTVIYGLIPQCDVHEFAGDILDILGTTLNKKVCVIPMETVHRYKKCDNTFIDSTSVQSVNTSFMLQISIQGEQLSINSFIKHYLEESKMDQYTLTPQQQAELNLKPHDVYATNTHKLTTTEAQAPNILLLQLKLTDQATLEAFSPPKIRRTITCPDKSKGTQVTVDVGCEVLCDLIDNDRIVTIPICTNNATTPHEEHYIVTAVACHIGSSVKSGHYVTLKFPESGEPIICDDTFVVGWQDYVNYYQLNNEVNTLTELIRHKGLSGYLYTLKRV